MTYQPAEDTYLLKEILLNDIKSSIGEKLRICEVGCGSGDIITTLAQEFSNNLYYATDINPQAIDDTQKLAKQKGVDLNINEGDFLTPFKHEHFDIIFFNTPYLPCEDGCRFNKLSLDDRAIYGGRVGCEVTNKFIDSLLNNIFEGSVIYMLISSLTQPKLVEENLRNNAFDFEIIATKSFFFEELLIYKIRPNKMLMYLLKNDYVDVKRFDKGKHSYIIQAQDSRGEIVMVKFGRREYISKESYYLKKLQDTSYSPQIVDEGYSFVVYKKIQGVTIEKFIEQCSRENYSLKEVEVVFNRVLEICYDLDLRGICKDEMTHPNEHIYINTLNLNEIYFIDFERSSMSNRFENTRQFLQFISKCNHIFIKLGREISKQKVIHFGRQVSKNVQRKIKLEDLYQKR